MKTISRRQMAKFFAPICTLVICLISLTFYQAASAQGGASARLEWYGVYTTKNEKEIDDPTSPTGKRFTVTPVAPRSNTDQIPGRDDVRFGLSYIISGTSLKSIRVKEVYVFPPPGMPDSVSHNPHDQYEAVDDAEVGVPHLMGWSFQSAPAERIVIGTWRFQVWQGNQLLLEKSFNVYRP